jgi:putative ABC transport system permease protein
MLALLRTFSWQELRHHPWRYLTALASIALGVALAFSVHLINASALGEFSSALQQVQGRPDVSVKGAGNFDETVFAQIAAQELVELASPVLEFSSYLLDAQGRKRAVKVIGVDGLVAPQLAPGLLMKPHQAVDGSADRFAWFAPQQAFLNAAAIQVMGTQVAGTASLQLVVGNQIISLNNAGSVAASGNALLVMDLGAMQDALNLRGQLSRIDLRLKPGADAKAIQLPANVLGLALQRPEQADNRTDQLSRAYRVNMTVLALVALFTGAFLVYSVLTLAVAKRAQQLALLGVLGLTQRQRMQLVLLEASLLGLVGAALGVALGALLAALGLKALGGDLGGGYFSGATPPLQWSTAAALVYALLGWLAALAGAWWPAQRAQSLPLAQTLKGLGLASSKQRKPWLAGLLVLAALVGAMLPPIAGIPLAAYLSVALLLLGGMGLLPWGVSLLYDRLAPRVATHALPLLAVERARRMREVAVVAVSGVVAALSLAVALTVMVSSFRTSVSQWLDVMLPAPMYARLTSSTQTAQGLYFPPQVVQQMAQLPGVQRVVGLRLRNLPVGSDLPDVQLIARPMQDVQEVQNALPWIGTLHQPPADLPANSRVIALYVSEAMVQLHGAQPGQIFDQKWLLPAINTAAAATKSIAIGSSQQPVVFYVAGVWRDYVRQFGAVVMDQADYQQLSGDLRVNDLAIWPQPGQDEAALQKQLRSLFSSDAQLAGLVEFSSGYLTAALL